MILALPIVVDPVERTRVLDSVRRLAQRHGLSVYDAAYLEVASRLGLPLATLDRPLMAAAREVGVGIASAEDPATP